MHPQEGEHEPGEGDRDCVEDHGRRKVHVLTEQPGRRAWATMDLDVRYLRPLSPGEGRLYARARTVHHRHRLAVTTVEITEADPRPAVLADASVILLPGPRCSGLERLTDEAHELTSSMRDDSQVPGGR